MTEVTATAPGKLMLMGEHAVVYGRPCLVTAVDRRLAVTITETQSGKVEIKAPQVNNTQFVEKALKLGVKRWKIKHQGLLVTTQSPFSGKYGLGSSAAVVVASLKALVGLFSKKVDNRELFKLAYQVILEVQGLGSGFDAAAAIFGGTLYFVTGGRVIEKVENKGSVLPLVVGYTGIKSNSVELVKQVAQSRQQFPEKVERILQAIGKLVDQGCAAYIAGDWEKLGKLMDFNQEYLRDLGVSSPQLENLILAAKRAGAWGAKLSGAGGGDCMIALINSEVDQSKPLIIEAIRKAGGEVVEVIPNAEGVRVES